MARFSDLTSGERLTLKHALAMYVESQTGLLADMEGFPNHRRIPSVEAEIKRWIAEADALRKEIDGTQVRS